MLWVIIWETAFSTSASKCFFDLGTEKFIQWEGTIIFIVCVGSYKVFIVLVVQSKAIKTNKNGKHSLSSQIQSEFIYLNFGRLAGIQGLYWIVFFSFVHSVAFFTAALCQIPSLKCHKPLHLAINIYVYYLLFYFSQRSPLSEKPSPRYWLNILEDLFKIGMLSLHEKFMGN